MSFVDVVVNRSPLKRAGYRPIRSLVLRRVDGPHRPLPGSAACLSQPPRRSMRIRSGGGRCCAHPHSGCRAGIRPGSVTCITAVPETTDAATTFNTRTPQED
jgi:hypothetical protein